MDKLDKLMLRIISVSFYLLFIIVPLILTPWNYELFEFNKMLTVYGLTTIIVGAWIARMILAKKIIFKKTPFDFPLLFFFVSQFLSFLFSLDRHTSFWGYYSRFHGGLLSTGCYLLLFWAFVSNIPKHPQDEVKNYLKIILATATLVSLYGIAEHFGIDAHLWVQDVKNRVFSTLGQPNWLAAWLAVLIPITMGLTFNSKFKIQNSKFHFFIYYLLFIVYCLCFLYTKSQSGLLGLGVSLTFFWIIIFFKTFKDKFFQPREILSKWGIFSFSFLVLLLSVGLTAFPEIYDRLEKIGLIKKTVPKAEVSLQASAYQPPALEVGGTASGEIRKIVWKGAWEIFKHYPIFGSGVETFAYSYYNQRPVEHNLVSEWDFLYNKAHNEYLNFLATTGIIGLGSYLLFIGWFVFWSIKKLKTQNLNIILHLSLQAGFFGILVTNFFGFSVVPVALFFFLIPAFCFVLSQQKELETQNYKQENLNLFQKISLMILLIVVLYLLFSILNLWRADFHYAKGVKLNKINRYDLAFGELLKAIQLNKTEPVYKNEIAEIAANLALISFHQKEVTSASKFAQISLTQSTSALTTSPKNLNFWKGRIKILYSLSQINRDFSPLVIEAFQQAIKLAPTDPKLRYNLGLVYGNFGQTDLAVKLFKEAINLKPNYKDSRYALALYLKEMGEIEEVKTQLQYILKNISPNDSPSATLLEELKR